MISQGEQSIGARNGSRVGIGAQLHGSIAVQRIRIGRVLLLRRNQEFQARAEGAVDLSGAPSHHGFQLVRGAILAQLAAHDHDGAGLDRGHQLQANSAVDDIDKAGVPRGAGCPGRPAFRGESRTFRLVFCRLFCGVFWPWFALVCLQSFIAFAAAGRNRLRVPIEVARKYWPRLKGVLR